MGEVLLATRKHSEASNVFRKAVSIAPECQTYIDKKVTQAPSLLFLLLG
jgi:hypothetical protein